MKTLLKTAPAGYPVTLAEAKEHLRIPILETREDAYIDSLIRIATAQAEKYTGRRFFTQTWYAYLPGWPIGDRFEIPFGKLQSVTAITYRDYEESGQTFSSSNYLVNISSDPGFVCLAYGESWPSDQLSPNLPITIEFICGYGTATAIPDDIKQAIKTRIADLFESRENTIVSAGLTTSVNLKVFESLLWPYKVFVL